MGHIYKRTWKDKEGNTRQSNIFWIKYYRDGRPFFESSQSTKRGDATRLLKDREGDIVKGVPISPRIGRVKFKELAEDVLNDYRINEKKTYDQAEGRFRIHILPYFGDSKASSISTSSSQKYITRRLGNK